MASLAKSPNASTSRLSQECLSPIKRAVGVERPAQVEDACSQPRPPEAETKRPLESTVANAAGRAGRDGDQLHREAPHRQLRQHEHGDQRPVGVLGLEVVIVRRLHVPRPDQVARPEVRRRQGVSGIGRRPAGSPPPRPAR